MTIRYAVLPILCSFAAVPALAHPGSSHTYVPPNSFLNYHVASVRELSQEVTLDPAVRARLANHFHISEAQITQYVRRNLVLTHLQKPGRYRVACVGRDGHEFWIESRLPRGTAVFASRATGQPILRLACGNPMVSALPPSLQTADDNGGTKPAQFAALDAPAPTDALPMPGLMPGGDLPAPVLVASTDVAPTTVEVAGSLQNLLPAAPLSGAGHAFNALPAVLGALAAGAVGIASTRHGDSNSNAAPPPAVPESSTAVSLGAMLLLGAAGSLAFRRRRLSAKAD